MAKFLDSAGLTRLWSKIKAEVGKIDLTLYRVVDALPELADAELNKIYLVPSAKAGEKNVYTEYACVESGEQKARSWEKLGEYKSDVDLAPYVKFTDLATAAKAGAMSAADKKKLDGLTNYTLPAATKDVLGGVKVGAGLAVDAQGVLSATGGGTADAVEWENVLNKPALKPVATSGSYADLTDKPALKAVATSGSYNDLENKPAIPAAQVQSDWNATTGMGAIKNKPALKAVATTGSYNDLTDKPSIPAVDTALTDAEIDAICV